MSEIQIGAKKAERLIAQVLRDDFKLLPAKANEAASIILMRLDCSMATPTNPRMQGFRLIGPSPASRTDFQLAVTEILPGTSMGQATALWRAVWTMAGDLPKSVADALR